MFEMTFLKKQFHFIFSSHTHDSTDDIVEIDPNEESPEDIVI